MCLAIYSTPLLCYLFNIAQVENPSIGYLPLGHPSNYYYTHVRVYVNSKSTYSPVPEDRQSGQRGKKCKTAGDRCSMHGIYSKDQKIETDNGDRFVTHGRWEVLNARDLYNASVPSV